MYISKLTTSKDAPDWGYILKLTNHKDSPKLVAPPRAYFVKASLKTPRILLARGFEVTRWVKPKQHEENQGMRGTIGSVKW